MVSATVLAILAAAGLTYGWQPDPTARQNGGDPADSLEYIVQISPDAVDEITKRGQATSLIDPSVRGRISRVVVRIGNGPLPRIDPAADDRVAMAIPQIGTGLNPPIAGVRSRPAGRSVMKPGFGDPGFGNPQFDAPNDAATRSAAGNFRFGDPAAALADAKSAVTAAGQQTAADLRSTTMDALGRSLTQAGQRVSELGRPESFAGMTGPSTTPSRRVTPPSLSGELANTQQLNGSRELVGPAAPSTWPRPSNDRDPTYLRSRGLGLPSTDPTNPNDSAIGRGQPTGRLPMNDLRQDAADRRVAPALPRRDLPVDNTNTRDAFGRDTASRNPQTLGPLQPNGLQHGPLQPNGLQPSDGFGRLIGQNVVGANPAEPIVPRLGRRRDNNQTVLIDSDNAVLTTTEVLPALRAIGGAQIYQGQLYDQSGQVIDIDSVTMALRRHNQNTLGRDDLAANSRNRPIRENDVDRDIRSPSDDRFGGPASFDNPLSNSRLNRATDDYPTYTGSGRQSRSADRDRASFGRDRRGDDRYPDSRYLDDRRDERYDERLADARYAEDIARRRDSIDTDRRRLRRPEDDAEGLRRRDEDSLRVTSTRRSETSPSSTITEPRRTASTVHSSPIQHNTTPFFHAVLIGSGIINAYLFVWVRNMRVRYRDMVASKRSLEPVV